VTERLLDRETVARVLHRATGFADDPHDLQLQRGDISEQALVDAAAEVGIDPSAVRRALAVERLDPPPRRHTGDRVLGASLRTVDAEVVGSAPDVLALIDSWLVDGHHLRRDRLRDARGVWTRRRGILGRTVRTVRGATGEGRLGRVRRVSASTAETGTGTTMVRVELDQSPSRRRAAVGAGATAVAVVGVAAVGVATGPVFLVGVPIALLAGVGVTGRARSQAADTAREIDRVLDAVDQGIAPTRLRVDIARRIAGRPTHPVVALRPAAVAGRPRGSRA